MTRRGGSRRSIEKIARMAHLADRHVVVEYRLAPGIGGQSQYRVRVDGVRGVDGEWQTSVEESARACVEKVT